MRTIKFRAWIPDLEITLDNITLYGNGQMGYDEDDFKAALPEGYVLDYDYEGVIRNFINNEGDEDFEKIMPVLLGEDWIWLEEGEFIPMQFTGLTDKNGVEIYEGDILKLPEIYDRGDGLFDDGLFEVKWEDAMFIVTDNEGYVEFLHISGYVEVTGNIHDKQAKQ